MSFGVSKFTKSTSILVDKFTLQTLQKCYGVKKELIFLPVKSNRWLRDQ